jgi:DUF4097 and DUF4098 domain-containing protein YvlB
MDEIMEQTFSCGDTPRLSVSNIRGSVYIKNGEDGEIKVTACKLAGTGDVDHTELQMSQSSDGSVNVTVRYPGGDWRWLLGWNPCEVQISVQAPRHTAMNINGVSNNIQVQGFSSPVKIKTVSGDISIRDLESALEIHSVSGDIEGQRISGTLDLDTVSGDLSLQDTVLDSINSKSVSGDISIQSSLQSGPYEFHSVSGDVRMELPPDTCCSAELKSISGEIQSPLPISGYAHHQGSQVVSLKSGGTKISMNSLSGDLYLGCSQGIPSTHSSSEEKIGNPKLAILEHLEQGEISVEEALNQLIA